MVIEVVFQRNRSPVTGRVCYRFDKPVRAIAVERIVRLARECPVARGRIINRLLLEVLSDEPLPTLPSWDQVVSYLKYLARNPSPEDARPPIEVRHTAQRILVVLLAKATSEGRSAAAKGLTQQVLRSIALAITEGAGVYPPVAA